MFSPGQACPVSDVWKLNLELVVVHSPNTLNTKPRASLSQFYIIKLGTFHLQHYLTTALLIELEAMGVGWTNIILNGLLHKFHPQEPVSKQSNSLHYISPKYFR